MNGPLQRQWKAAMQQEYASLLENHTFGGIYLQQAYRVQVGI